MRTLSAAQQEYSGVGILSTILSSQVLFDFEGEDPHLSEDELSFFTLKIDSSLAVYSPVAIADDDPTRVQFDHKLIQHCATTSNYV